jgi:hypothetical protein
MPRSFTGYTWNTDGPTRTAAKVATLVGSHDTSDNQSRLTKAALGHMLHSNIKKPNENHDNNRTQLPA